MLLMHHFGETSFGPEQCRQTCDVCQANKAADRKVEGERSAGTWLQSRLCGSTGQILACASSLAGCMICA